MNAGSRRTRVGLQVALLAGVASLCVAPMAAAQRLDRSVRPTAAPAAPFVFPATHTAKLDNGLTVIVVENHALPLVAVRLEISASEVGDPRGKEGLFMLDTAMLREGSTDLSPEQQASTMGQIGNRVSAFGFTTITSSFAASLRLMADMLTRPAFSAAAFDRLKSARIAAEPRIWQNPPTIGYHVLWAKMFGQASALARTVAPTEASLSAITLDDLRAYHDSTFRPNAATVIVVGDVETADAVAAVRSAFENWQSGPVRPPVAASALAPEPTTIYLVDHPGLRQSYVLTGEHALDRTASDAYALDMLAPILGSTLSSRLMQNLRERHSYAYAGSPITVSWQPPPIPSLLYGIAAVNTAKTDSVLIEWLGELRGMRDRPPSASEMALARGWVIGSLPGQIETDDRVADRLVYLRYNGLPLDYYDHYTAAIDAVTPADVTAAARRYIDPEHLVIVVVGDRKTVEPQLRAANLAPVVVIDDNGNPITAP
jgi:zinc protease